MTALATPRTSPPGFERPSHDDLLRIGADGDTSTFWTNTANYQDDEPVIVSYDLEYEGWNDTPMGLWTEKCFKPLARCWSDKPPALH